MVVATRDRPALLAATLGALAEALGPADSVVVADSASTDRRVGQVAERAGARLVRCDRPGTCRARNAGWRAAETDLVAFTDDDCLPRADWLTEVAAAFAGAAGLAFCTGQVLADAAPAGRAQLQLSLLESATAATFGPGGDATTFGHGANMAWSRRALEDIGGFDEAMGPGTPLRAAEDHDAFWRALAAGRTGAFHPGSVVVHRQWRTRRRDQLRAYHGYGIGSGALAVKRWRLAGGPGAAPLPLGALAGHVARELVWAEGAVPIGRNLAARYEMGVVAETVKLAGALAGAARARRVPLSGGRYQAD